MFCQGATSEDHGTPEGRKKVNLKKRRDGAQRGEDEGAHLRDGHRWLNEGEHEPLDEVFPARGDPGIRRVGAALLPGEARAQTVKVATHILVLGACESIDASVYPAAGGERHTVEVSLSLGAGGRPERAGGNGGGGGRRPDEDEPEEACAGPPAAGWSSLPMTYLLTLAWLACVRGSVCLNLFWLISNVPIVLCERISRSTADKPVDKFKRIFFLKNKYWTVVW